MHIVFHILVFGSNFRIHIVSGTGFKFWSWDPWTTVTKDLQGIPASMIIKLRNPLKFAGRIIDEMKANALSKSSSNATTDTTSGTATTVVDDSGGNSDGGDKTGGDDEEAGGGEAGDEEVGGGEAGGEEAGGGEAGGGEVVDGGGK